MDRAFAYKNKTDILMKSSSGGAFLGVAEAFMEYVTEGHCYGARFTDDFDVIHSVATDIKGCEAFCGSKYVQSNLKDCFKQVEKLLKAGKAVLFTGTPCQIAAIITYAQKTNCSTEKLFTLDIVCHGTPNQKIWKEYVNYLERKFDSKLKKFSFRYKPRGWKGYPIYAEFENGIKRINTLDVSTYQNIFRKDLLMRESCFHCKYPGNFQSDLTVCDFWGVELLLPELSTNGGVSLILSHTEKGNQLVEIMKKNEQTVLVEIEGEEYKKYNHNIVESTIMPENYHIFWKEYEDFGLEYVLRKYGGESITGKIKFYTKRVLRDTGILTIAKRVFRRA